MLTETWEVSVLETPATAVWVDLVAGAMRALESWAAEAVKAWVVLAERRRAAQVWVVLATQTQNLVDLEDRRRVLVGRTRALEALGDRKMVLEVHNLASLIHWHWGGRRGWCRWGWAPGARPGQQHRATGAEPSSPVTGQIFRENQLISSEMCQIHWLLYASSVNFAPFHKLCHSFEASAQV